MASALVVSSEPTLSNNDMTPAAAAAGDAAAAASPTYPRSANICADSSRIQLASFWSPSSNSAAAAQQQPAAASTPERFELRRMEDSKDEAWVSSVRALFLDYFAGMGIDMSFQNVDAELAHLPGDKYTAPSGGCLYTLHSCGAAAAATQQQQAAAEQLVGCVALRDLGEGIAEAKRLYVRPAWRGRDFGRMLLVQIIEVARQAGYSTIRLDTLARFAAANALYAQLGFQRIDPYNFNPQPDVLYFELRGLQDRSYLQGREAAFELVPKAKTLSASPPPVASAL